MDIRRFNYYRFIVMHPAIFPLYLSSQPIKQGPTPPAITIVSAPRLLQPEIAGLPLRADRLIRRLAHSYFRVRRAGGTLPQAVPAKRFQDYPDVSHVGKVTFMLNTSGQHVQKHQAVFTPAPEAHAHQ